MEEYVIYPIKNYKINNFNDFIKKYVMEFDSIEDICEELKNDRGYHFRIKKNAQYIFLAI
ncbi:hypothetical protein BMW23_0003 [Bodo saltans virus]|uniref:Uncharacterized protein n=1 Tax=Bodo saltans virus TaxID=2024608 RepID=A0A2H4UT90_9VIRU|nr:hypothetical protein QJ851_gp0003 [Bodo saltans virus]ATZ80066.1 hypothetical protein BMW23_0003 [Bodo saltans virus]